MPVSNPQVSSEEPVRLAIEDNVAVLTLARPETGNAMDESLLAALEARVGSLDQDPRVRAILIEADGKNFCVGGNLRAFAGEPDPSAYIGKIARSLHRSITALTMHRAPVIVAVQGAAAGAGLSLAASGDLVLAASTASFTMAYAGVGLTADGGATWLLPRLIGLRNTQELAYTGRRLNADEAATLGLVTRIVTETALHTEARGLAGAISRGPTEAFGRIKQLLADSGAASLTDHLDAEAKAIEQAMATTDAREGIAAFLERRRAEFSGF